jgi:hypothetical protein
MRKMRLTAPWFGIDRLQPQGAQPPRSSCVMHLIALPPSPGSHPPHPRGRRGGLLLSQ